MKDVSETREKRKRKCSQCGTVLSMRNPGTLCFACQRKELEQLTTGDNLTYDVEDMAGILRLESEQVRRLARSGKLPSRVPAVRRWLWSREVVHRWINSDGRLPKESSFELAALAATADVQWVRTFNEASGQWELSNPTVIFPVAPDGNRLKPQIYTLSIPDQSESP